MSNPVVDKKEVNVKIQPPKFGSIKLTIVGTAPLVTNAFPAKAREEMREKQEKGSQAQKEKTRDPKDFQALYKDAMHISKDGWCGIPAPAFRAAMISACRVVGFKMTIAKLSVFVVADGYDAGDGTPLVKITKGEPRYVEHLVRNATGVVDIRPRPMWDEGWGAEITMRWDTEQFSHSDVINLLNRAGMQVGVGEGRPDSKNSAGMGWGTFIVQPQKQENANA
jgi:hypothetical protein